MALIEVRTRRSVGGAMCHQDSIITAFNDAQSLFGSDQEKLSSSQSALKVVNGI